MAVFFQMYEKCYRKSCKYMRNKSARQRGKKKTSTSQYQSFEHNGMKIYDQQRMVQVQSLEALKALKGSSWFKVGSKLVQKWFKFKAL